MNENIDHSKKSILITLLIIVIALLSITSIIAYITRNTIAKNVITFGSIKMQLFQTTLDENNNEVEVNNEEDINITHKSKLSRLVKIKNLGKHEFFARISLNMNVIENNNQEVDVNKYVKYNINTEDWFYKNGWYYYKKIVKQNEITSNLLTEIDFDTNSITSSFPEGKINLDIKAEAVQAENNEENVLDALGWPSK